MIDLGFVGIVRICFSVVLCIIAFCMSIYFYMSTVKWCEMRIEGTAAIITVKHLTRNWTKPGNVVKEKTTHARSIRFTLSGNVFKDKELTY